ncbi:hypothetical protein Tsubulata_003195 [Turnera subulata]|uniref:Uncharacterized protein n=1 Tax=Turnera subulata TaxID=218843 RepID=A0A9Q0G0F5_9ROSI|nr:hypothetical protein Tsubulata_003195 [Turnera subulata]
MGSSYFGEPNFGNERGGAAGSSRKSKKSNSDKPKQPQRGLGVAQLEKIRLNGQMGCNYHPSLHATPYPTNFSQEDIRVQTSAYPIPSPSFTYSSSSSASSASYGLHPNVMMGHGHDYERTTIRYGDSQPYSATSWHPGNSMFDTQHFAQSSSTRHLLNLQVEDTQHKTSKKHRSSNSVGSSSQNSESNDSQELDLELRLSI